MDEYVDRGRRRELEEGAYDRAIREKIAVEIAGFNVEDVDKDSDVGEDMSLLLGEIVFHKGILATS